MKKLLILLVTGQMCFGQSIETQTEILSRKPCVLLHSYQEFKKVSDENKIDYVIVTNCDTVNVFYYNNGTLNVIRPEQSDVLLSVRDEFNKVVEYPYLFFDKSSWDKNVLFRVGVCEECKNSTLGAKYGSLH